MNRRYWQKLTFCDTIKLIIRNSFLITSLPEDIIYEVNIWKFKKHIDIEFFCGLPKECKPF
jgi:hypothetical protein